MNLILFGGFLSAGHYMGMSVGCVISVLRLHSATEG